MQSRAARRPRSGDRWQPLQLLLRWDIVWKTRACRQNAARLIAMQSPREILHDVWISAGGDPAVLDAVTLTGEEPQLPSSFRVAAAAQVSIAASGLAAAEIWKMRNDETQNV